MDESTMERLAAAAARSPSDAQAWHSYGLAASTATRPFWRKGNMGSTRAANLVIVAESSLARAVRLAPDSVSYTIDLAKHLFGVSATNLSRAERVLEQALSTGDVQDKSPQLSQVRDLLGLLAWRRFEVVANRRATTLEPRRSIFLTHAQEFSKWFELYTSPFSPPLGTELKASAAEHFRRAVDLDAQNDHAIRHELMVIAEDADWRKLLMHCEMRLSSYPEQPWLWLARGLAHHRLGQSLQADHAFQQGLARLSDTERAPLTDVSRILSPQKAKSFAALPDSMRARAEALFWNVGNPTLLIPGNLFRSEYLARVVLADLRWTDDEQHVRGIDSDFGNAYVRFGPPAIRASFKFATDTGPNIVWAWPRLSLHLFFRQAPLYGTANLNPTYRSELLEPIVSESQANFAEVPGASVGRDTLVASTSRFRGRGDSVVVALFARAQRVQGKYLKTDSAELGLFALTKTGVRRAEQLTMIVGAPRFSDPDSAIAMRVSAPSDVAAVRTDLLLRRDSSAARWMIDLSALRATDFGVSDLLVANGVSLRGDAPTEPRWFHFDIGGNAEQVFSRKRPLNVLWEIYELSRDEDGASRFRVALDLERQDPKGVSAVFAKLVGVAGSAVGVSTPSRSRVILSYDKALPQRAVLAEHLRLDTSGAPNGAYRMTITITDLKTGGIARAQRPIVLKD